MKFQINRYNAQSNGQMPIAQKGSVVAIGNFDGVHKGHQFLLQQAKNMAERLGLPLIVLTFYPHPKKVFMPKTPILQLTNFAKKCRLLQKNGANGVFIARFTKSFAKMAAEDFVIQILCASLNAKHVFVGAGFCFGYQRKGDTALLRVLGTEYGYGVNIVPPLCLEGQVVSSTRIRQSITEGKHEEAAYLLGH